MALKINKRLAKPISYGAKRSLKSVKYIVIHYTGNKGDTAKNNADYFATGNTRKAGAHFFVDKKGEIWNSIKMNRIAWSVGGKYSLSGGAGSYYGKCTNVNSVSIELCDCVKDTNWEQMLATRRLVHYIQKKCPNAKTIIRHWDVNGKECPLPMFGSSNEKWVLFYRFITSGYEFKAKVKKDAFVRSTPKTNPNNKIGTLKKGKTVKIVELKGNWGKIQGKTVNGENQWVTLNKIEGIMK